MSRIQAPPDWKTVLDLIPGPVVTHALTSGLRPEVNGKYRHWDKLRRMTPPLGMSDLQWWAVTKAMRNVSRVHIPFLWDDAHQAFHHTWPDSLRVLLMQARQASTRINELTQGVGAGKHAARFSMATLVEEAITSSQLEGAATTTREAKEMIRSGRRPRTEGERMIANNYEALQHVLEASEDELSISLIEHLHDVLMDGLLDPSAAYRTDDDQIVIRHRREVVHVPPSATETQSRLESLIAFANTEASEDPILKAIMLHFAVGFIHPFKDGNGRIARALFYWMMLHRGHSAIQYVSISALLKRSPARYTRAYQYTETDEGDLTYFLLFQLKVYLAAIDRLEEYVRHKLNELRTTRSLPSYFDLNDRQAALINHARTHPDTAYSIKYHQRSHGVAYDTARTDLQDLVQKTLLVEKRDGRKYVYLVPDDLEERISG